MSKATSTQTLPGSRIQCRETSEELVFYLPPRTTGGWITGAAAFVVTLVVSVGFITFLIHEFGRPPAVALFFLLPLGIIALVVWGLFLFASVSNALTETWVHLTREHLVVKTKTRGRERVAEYPVHKGSYARQHWIIASPSSDADDTLAGIQIVSDDNTSSESAAQFGRNLSRGEVEWVEWRINRFLGHATDAQTPAGMMASPQAAPALIEGVPDEPLAPPEDIKIRIDEDFFETRFHVPGTVAMGSYKGIGMVAWGLLFVGVPLFYLITGAPIFLGVFALFGLLLLFGGLTQLFGRSRLTISPERITVRVTLFGLLPFYWKTVRTADVLSSKGYVIRTASRELCYSDYVGAVARNRAQAAWLAGEIALRIQAARSGASVPPIELRQRKQPLKPVDTTGKPPEGPVPYDLHQRPMPSGTGLDTLLPAQVGPFACQTSHDEEEPDAALNAEYGVKYRCDTETVTVTLSIRDNAERARAAVAAAHRGASDERHHPEKRFSLDTEPSFSRLGGPSGAFMAWSRGNYFFTAWVRGASSENVLDRFMKAFPY